MRNIYCTILVQGAEAIGKSSGQALTAIQQLFNQLDFNNIGYAFTAIASLAGFLPLVVATVLSLGVVPPFYVAIKNLEARWFPEPQQKPAG